MEDIIEYAVTLVGRQVKRCGFWENIPRVGCVIVDTDEGWIYGMGHSTTTEHAELMAIDEISSYTKSRMIDGTVNATLFVNKLPCTKCARAIIAAGVKAIIITNEGL